MPVSPRAIEAAGGSATVPTDGGDKHHLMKAGHYVCFPAGQKVPHCLINHTDAPCRYLIIGNTHAGETNPQLIEVTREKKVVWTFRDFKNFGNSLAAAMVLDVKGVTR